MDSDKSGKRDKIWARFLAVEGTGLFEALLWRGLKNPESINAPSQVRFLPGPLISS